VNARRLRQKISRHTFRLRVVSPDNASLWNCFNLRRDDCVNLEILKERCASVVSVLVSWADTKVSRRNATERNVNAHSMRNSSNKRRKGRRMSQAARRGTNNEAKCDIAARAYRNKVLSWVSRLDINPNAAREEDVPPMGGYTVYDTRVKHCNRYSRTSAYE
jgi:hypothetical protein